MRAVRTLVDPFALLIAGAVGAALVAIQEGPVLAILAAASVLAVAVGANVAAEKLRRPAPAPQAAPPPAVWYAPLTRRQSEIASLVAEYLSNKVIAERLGIGERGVETTVQNIFAKLSEYTRTEFHSRTQIAVWVKERQMQYGVLPATTPAPK